MRIISCVPSISELIFDLNPSMLVGRTKFCIHPVSIKKISSVGGTKNLDFAKIKLLQPDLVISVKEENERCEVDEISKTYKVKTFDIQTLDDCLDMISDVGDLLLKKAEAGGLISTIKRQRNKLPFFEGKSVAYLIWQKPWMTIGGGTFINSMLEEIGLTNIFSSQSRYPEITDLKLLKELSPDFVFLSTEPFPFKEKHRFELQAALPLSKVLLVDGTYFSWYGSRITRSWSYFKSLVENSEMT